MIQVLGLTVLVLLVVVGLGKVFVFSPMLGVAACAVIGVSAVAFARNW